MPSLGQWAREALNVVPADGSYRPLNGLSGPLLAHTQGAAWLRGTDGATDETKHFLSSSAIDPVRGLYVFAYPADCGAFGGMPNRLLICNWQGWGRV
jgi:hypothetical protein